jgi:hypothetical protein
MMVGDTFGSNAIGRYAFDLAEEYHSDQDSRYSMPRLVLPTIGSTFQEQMLGHPKYSKCCVEAAVPRHHHPNQERQIQVPGLA